MVNNTRYSILNALRNKDRIVSGRELSNQLGISRVAVWKNINRLREYGYKIESASKGYKFLSAPDLLLPYEFPEYKDIIVHFDSVVSTMNAASDLNDPEDMVFVVSETQTKGRGRMGSAWNSGRGGIYTTLILNTRIPIFAIQSLNIFASMAVALTIHEICGVEARIKWPNEIMINKKKVAGILLEIRGNMDYIDRAFIGIGINVNNRAGKQNHTTLENELGRKIDRKELFRRLISNFVRYRENLGKKDIVDDYSRFSGILGRHIRIKSDGKTISGTVAGFDESGALFISKNSGGVQRILAGEIL